ncbi:MAG: hypothetical protein JJ913_16915 [Rhizobiaceae bacterium]|nr:hypothetical protein [Rhizobiaceae bacterium]
MAGETEQLFLVHFRLTPDAELPSLDYHGDGEALADGLLLIYSELSQSKLYHRIKWQLPDGTPLIVAELSQLPKFKGMAEGSTAWIRDRSN